MAHFNAHDTECARIFSGIYSPLGNQYSMFQYYLKSRKLERWSRLSICSFSSASLTNGSKAKKDLTNFSAKEFEQIKLNLQSFITRHYNTGRGNRSQAADRDVLLILFIGITPGGQWNVIGRFFDIKGPTLQCMITRSVSLISNYTYLVFVKNWGGMYNTESHI